MEDKIKIECQNCNACFMLPLQMIGPHGKKVRCTKCQHTWTAIIDKSIPETFAPETIEQTENNSASLDTTQRFFYSAPLNKKKSFLSYLLLTMVSLGTIIFMIVWGRYHILSLAPNTSTLYQKMGIPVSAKYLGYSFEDLSYSKIMHQGIASLLIRGRIKNTSSITKPAPLTKVGLIGKGLCPPSNWKDKIFGNDFGPYEANHCILKKWFVKIREYEILPGQSIPFETIWPLHPSWQIKNIYVDFESKVS